MAKKVKMTMESEPIELEEEAFEQLIEELENFEESALAYLCGTANYQVLPNEDEEGNLLTREEMRQAAKQVKSLGYTLIYRVDTGKQVYYFEPKAAKILIETEQIN